MPLEFALTALPFAVAFVVSLLFGPGVIDMLKRRRIGQTIQADGPESHKPKAGTPTMGGLIIIAGVLVGALVTALALDSLGLSIAPETGIGRDLLPVIILAVAYGLLGMIDDYLTIHPINGVRGIASKPKAAVQILIAVAFVMWLAIAKPTGFMPLLSVAGVPILSGWLYWIFAVVFIAGMANFVNITDGLDGLVAGLTAIAALTFVVSTIMIPGTGAAADLTIYGLMSAISGACVAFLWFNANPAKVFMGDTGALAIGAALPAVAILTHREILLIIIGMVFILDGLSTALQWAVFKYTRIRTGTGRRVFKKSPVHHHFEMSGWPEQTVVVRFWVTGIVAALVAFSGAAFRIW
ncbi:MAG: phospho-N-acetylmuramoyl-pentapeptide-transferase [Armatimonadota bacterium]|nr:phospho-N-acetylmuramoyl-pentapeptide-transferase [bacterium]